MERRNNLLEKFNAVQTEVASLLEGIMNEKNEIKTLKDNLDLRLEKSHNKINILKRQIEFYKVAHSKLKNIFLTGLEVFKQVDFRSNASIELNKFSLEVLQKHFLEYIDEVSSLSEIPTEQQLEHYISQKNTKFLEDSKTKCIRNIIISSSDSEDGDPDDTNLELGTAWNPKKSGGGIDEELLRDSGLESVKEEIGANEIDFIDIQFDEDFFASIELAADEMNKGRSEVVKSGNVTGTQNITVPSTSGSNTVSGFLVEVKPEVVILDENQPGNQNPQGRNIPESLNKKNCQSNEPARGIYNSAILDETPRPEKPIVVMCNPSREPHLEKGLGNSSREKHYQEGVTRHENYTSELRCYKTPGTATTEDMTVTMINPGSRSPVFKDCNSRTLSGTHTEDFSRNCSTPFRQLNENFGRTLFNLRGCSRTSEKNKVLGRRSTYKKPRQEENGPSDARKLSLPFLNMESFNGKNQEQGMRSEDRENESLERDRLSDCSVYNHTTEEDDDDDDDDIIYGSPEKVNQLYVNPRRQKVQQEISEKPSCQPIPQKSAAPDLDETFISPSVVKKYQMSRGIPQGYCTREANPGCDSVPFAYQRGPVRKRAERMKLPGQACAECDKYYNNAYKDANSSDYNRMLNKCSRHRNAGGQDDTPPGYWTPFLTGNEKM